MYVIDVIPLSRTAPELLSYRTAEYMPVGTVVQITVRKTVTQGIVIQVTPVSEAKEMLKHARFTLLRSTPIPAGMIPEETLLAARDTAVYHATSEGSVLAALLAEHLKAGAVLPQQPLPRGDGYVLGTEEAPLEERAAAYEQRITGGIADGRATLLVIPTIAELLYWKRRLALHKPLVLSGTLSGARRAQALQSALMHTGLVIATPSFSWVPIQNLHAVIIDRVSAGTYVLPKRPYLSVVHALQSLCRRRSVPLTLGDFPLPIEYRATPSRAPAQAPRAQIRVIDARRDPDEQKDASVAWRALPEGVLEGIRTAHAAGMRIVVLSARKGYAPAVVCRDCGQAQADERGMPLSFTMAGGERRFVSSDGATVRSAHRACERCESWNLLPLGIGAERVQEELLSALEGAPCAYVSAEELTTPAKARKLLADIPPTTILIGTEALLPWLYATIQSEQKVYGVIASADSLLSLPFWRARERFVRLCYLFAGLAEQMVLVTRRPDDTALDAVADSHSPLFWQEEVQLRTALRFPPFGTLITVHAARAGSAGEELHKKLDGLLPEGIRVNVVREEPHALTLSMQLPPEMWPDTALSSYIRSLPPSVRVRIDPESIW